MIKTELKDVLKVQVTTITSSFRNIRFQHGFLPSYPLPPISTLYGFLNSVVGKIIPKSSEPWIGMMFQSFSKSIEVRRLSFVIGKRKKELKQPVILREVLWDNRMTLYLGNHSDDKYNIDYFFKYLRNPVYSLYLGRSEDLATIEKIEKIKLSHVQDKEMIEINNQWIPSEFLVSGVLFNVPLYNFQRPKNVFKELKTLLQVEHLSIESEKLVEYPILFDKGVNMGVFFYN